MNLLPTAYQRNTDDAGMAINCRAGAVRAVGAVARARETRLKMHGGTGFRARRFALARLGDGDERIEQRRSIHGDDVDCALKCSLIGLRRAGKA